MHGRPDTELVVLAREGSSEAAAALLDRYWILACLLVARQYDVRQAPLVALLAAAPLGVVLLRRRAAKVRAPRGVAQPG